MAVPERSVFTQEFVLSMRCGRRPPASIVTCAHPGLLKGWRSQHAERKARERLLRFNSRCSRGKASPRKPGSCGSCDEAHIRREMGNSY